MTSKGLSVLESVINSGLGSHVSYVVVGRDAGISDDCHSKIMSIASKNGLSTYSRTDDPPRVTVRLFASWRWMVPAVHGVKDIVLHDSILPKLRGFAPIVHSLILGEKILGVSAIIASGEYDEGPIIAQQTVAVEYPLSINHAIEIVSGIYASIAVHVLSSELSIPLQAVEQKHDLATYGLWLDDDDYNIDWSKSAEQIQRFVDAVGYPYKGAVTRSKESHYRVIETRVESDIKIENRAPGKIVFLRSGIPTVVCGEGLLSLTELQNMDGSNALPIRNMRIRFY
jgi:methionyl-tRNA formyltransferase